MISGISAEAGTKTSIVICAQLKRLDHTYLNDIGEDNPVRYVQADGITPEIASGLVADDLKFHPSDDATNSGLGYDVTWIPDNPAWNAVSNTVNIPNVDNHPTDGKVFFEINGLTQGDVVTGYIEENSASNFGRRVRVSYSTIPVGRVRAGYFSCNSVYEPSLWPDAGDYGQALPLVRKLMNSIKPHIVFGLDDIYYQTQGQFAVLQTAPFAPCLTIADTAAEYQKPLATNSVDIFTPTTDRTQAEGWAAYHGMTTFYCSPFFQTISRDAIFYPMWGDHDVYPANDYHFDAIAGLDNAQSMAYHNLVGNWFFEFWRTPPTYDLTPNTGVLPNHKTEGVDNASAVNHLPKYYKVETDYGPIFVPDFQMHRSDRGDDSVTSTILGVPQKDQLKAELTAHAATDKYLTIGSPVQFMNAVYTNIQGWCSVDETIAPTAPDERNEVVNHIKALTDSNGNPVPTMVFSGDSHFPSFGIDGSMGQFVMSGSSRQDTWARAAFQNTGNADDSITISNELFLGTGPTATFSGDHEDSLVGGVCDDTIAANGSGSLTVAPGKTENLGCGMAFSDFQEDSAYHATFDASGVLLANIIQVRAAN